MDILASLPTRVALIDADVQLRDDPHHATVQALDLSGRGLPRLPPRALQYVALRALDLAHNHLVTFPLELTRLPYLRRLNLAHNALPALPAALARMPCLVDLDAGHNALVLRDADPQAGALLPPAAFAAPWLTHLRLAGNCVEAGWRRRLTQSASAFFVALCFGADGPPLGAAAAAAAAGGEGKGEGEGEGEGDAPHFPSNPVALACGLARGARQLTAGMRLLQVPCASPVDLVECLLTRARLLRRTGHAVAALPLLPLACDVAAAVTHRPTQARLLARATTQWAMALLGDGQQGAAARAFAAAAPWLQVARAATGWTPQAAASLAFSHGFAQAASGAEAAGCETLLTAATDLEACGELRRAAHAYHLAGTTLLHLGRPDAAAVPLQRSRALARQAPALARRLAALVDQAARREAPHPTLCPRERNDSGRLEEM